MGKILIGVMGPGEQATALQIATAYELGKGLARQGWAVLTGGRGVGVMDAACRGAKEVGGMTVGILPTSDRCTLSEAVDIPIFTDLGNARNNVNVLSSRVVIACGMGAGTASEVALAIKAAKPVILMQVEPGIRDFFQQLTSQPIDRAETVEAAIEKIYHCLAAE
ncbi:cytochrome [Pseudanabaena sp. FACHB-2040]|uniref:SLOG cluster 4 domain-containing protein n=1 Tax=Pseudanabaena sp. FACHB-2040 TaxID=2692859 RepID=UPI0016861D70|nr:cytochrome [Pseudanabaena sp. FACHB-2040]MBD2260868.1 LOG family protein [Pseudanabaena sp. FACHB-2040]